MSTSTSGSDGSETVEVRHDAMTAALRADAVEPIVPGTLVGRYRIEASIGSGGMGVVLRAHDPELDRDVALKRIRSDRASATSQHRLRREAQAMARLNHPNVVPVYGVEQGPDGSYIAMELVEGVSLSHWLAAEPRTAAEILDAFAAAGRGLVAAHDVGLVHRDFKPMNVLVGNDGRIRVMDFGLARSDEDSEADAGSDSVDEELTDHGVVMGTPAYMAPEQHAGHADARSDQYAFCVALWEALYGQRPFRGPDLKKAKLAGPPIAPVRRGLPPAIARVVARGLQPQSDARWPSMVALLEVLEDARDRGPRRRRRILVGAAIGLVAIAGTAVVLGGGEEPSRCTSSDELQGVWDEQARAQFDALAETSNDAEAMALVRARLDDWAQSFSRAHREACEAVGGDGEAAKTIDQRLGCLRRRRNEVRAHVELILGGGDDLVARAGALTEELPAVGDCTTGGAPVASVVSDEAQLAWLDQLSALMAAARYAEARVKIDERLPQAVDTSKPLAREVLGHDCHLLIIENRSDEALERCRRAYEEFSAAGDEVNAIEVGATLITLLGHGLGRLDDAEHWVGQVEALVDRLGHHSRAEVEFLEALGTLRTEQGRIEEGIAAHESAVRIHRNLESSTRLGLARTIGFYALSLGEAGRLDEAERHLLEALDILETDAGKMHPDVAVLLNLLGSIADDRGDLDAAWRHYERALQIVRRNQGASDEREGFLLNNLGMIAAGRGQFDEAKRLYTEGKAIKEKLLGPDHPSVGTSENNLGYVALQTNDPEAAERHFVRAVEIFRLVHDEGHPDVLQAKANAARAMLKRGQLEDALAEIEEAVAAAGRSKDELPILVYVLAVHGDALLQLGRFDDAVVPLERAVALGRDGEGSVQDRAAAQFMLARALERSDLERAQAEATEARGLVEAEGLAVGGRSPAAQTLLEEIDAWFIRIRSGAATPARSGRARGR